VQTAAGPAIIGNRPPGSRRRRRHHEDNRNGGVRAARPAGRPGAGYRGGRQFLPGRGGKQFSGDHAAGRRHLLLYYQHYAADHAKGDDGGDTAASPFSDPGRVLALRRSYVWPGARLAGATPRRASCCRSPAST
jgi:hypothetical protein